MRVIICGGGTGGHIYPALAIINIIKEKDKNSEFLYIGTHNRMEKDIIPKHNISYMPLEMYGLKRSLSPRNLKTAICYLKALKRCKRVIKDFDPDIVIGVGGYVTDPVIMCAKKLGYKTFIHEQNSIPGLSNKHLIKYADKMALSFESSIKYFKEKEKNKLVFTGNPCGDNALKIKAADKESLGLSKNKKLVLIVMGSLGSLKINEIISKMLPMFNGRDYEVLFVTGKTYYEEMKKIKVPKNVKIVDYIDNLTSVMKVTDLMVSRAGASTISEIIALKIPTIFIPSPYVTNNHQYKNAMDLVDSNSAFIIEEKDLKGDILVRNIDKIFRDKLKYNAIKENISNIGIKNSSIKIFNEIKKVIGDNGGKND